MDGYSQTPSMLLCINHGVSMLSVARHACRQAQMHPPSSATLSKDSECFPLKFLLRRSVSMAVGVAVRMTVRARLLLPNN
jgi:hypothetical protein